MPYGFGIIGCGMIARFHDKAIADVKGAKLVACFDNFSRRRISSRRKQAARLSSTGRNAGRSGSECCHHRHAQRRSHGAGRCSGECGQACDRRKAAGNHAQALRCDYQCLPEEQGETVDRLSVAVPRFEPGTETSDRRRTLWQAHGGRRLCEMVSHAAILRQRRGGARGSSMAAGR